ncbi:MOSC domain-containing protein [Arthrobacter frigidicola]|nr:MOSC domain-containing protein [Arthrobacter frigidicola]
MTEVEGVACGRLVSLNVGVPKGVSWQGKTVHTGVYKTPVERPLMVRRLNIDGDGQGDLHGHGGEQRAVLVYQRQSYEHWSGFLGRGDLTPGSFAENFTIDGLPDDEVCIGDRYRIGEAEFEVTQPRVTCFRVGMRLGEPRMPALLVDHRRPGFYLRVITEGEVRPGDPILRTLDGPHRLTVAEADALLYLPNRSQDALRKAVDIPALSPGWQQSFQELLDTDLAKATVTGAPVEEPGWSGFRPMTITKTVPETPTITSVYLRAGDDVPLEPIIPGQYLTLRVSVNEAVSVRSYSISDAPDPHTYRISVRQEEHGLVSRYLHEGVLVGGTIDVAAPRGQFRLHAGTGPVLLVSAGVGATPLVPMLQEFARTGSDREIWWIHVARNPSEHVFAGEVRGHLNRLPHAHSAIFYTRAATPVADSFSGRPTADQLRSLRVPAGAAAYLCGPPAFIGSMTDALTDLGVDAGSIYSELFSTLPPINPGLVDASTAPPHQPSGEPGTGPAVTFARSGLTARWRAGDASLLELAEACDVPTRWSCRTGVCHTCLTAVISGKVAYQPVPLETPADSQALICCARPTEDVVLDS